MGVPFDVEVTTLMDHNPSFNPNPNPQVRRDYSLS